MACAQGCERYLQSMTQKTQKKLSNKRKWSKKAHLSKKVSIKGHGFCGIFKFRPLPKFEQF